MNVIKQDAYFWKVAYTLVIKQPYRVISLQTNELWLADDSRKKVIRLVRADFDWSNQLKTNMEMAFAKLDGLRTQLRWKTIEAETIYVAVLPPVDDWEYLVKRKMNHPNGKVQMNSYLIEQVSEGYKVTPDQMPLDLPNEHEVKGEEEYEKDISYYKQAVRASVEKKQNQEKQTFSRGKPIVSYIMLTAVILMYIWLEYAGGSTNTLNLIQWGAKYNPLIIEGERWRLFSAMFLHIGFFHLMMNGLALYFLGTLVERIFGSIRFFFIYMIAGLIGSLASFAFMGAVSAGASGAIFGCFGALLYFGLIHRELFFRTMGQNVIVILVINLVFGFVVQGIDMGAHLGGLAGGFLAAALVKLPSQKGFWIRYAAGIGVVVVASTLWIAGNQFPSNHAQTDLQIAAEYIDQGSLDEAVPFLERAHVSGEELPEVPFYLAYIYLNQNQNAEAIPLLEEAIRIRPEFHEAIYNLALAYALEGNTDEAKTLVEEAISIEPDEQMYLDLQSQIEESS
ncbi:rhomboid family intramembrane serine protease [Alkalihalobacillus sp. FSL W8-0930]